MKTATALDSIRLCTACMVDSDGQWYCGILSQDAPCSRCDSWEAWHVLLPEANEPRLEGHPCDPEFTTCVSVARRVVIIYDVNGYYRDLGVDPYATRKEIRDAYLARDGHTSTRLTFVLKQLLQDDVRAAYDTTPLGSVFFDAEVAAEVKRRIAEEVKQSRMMGPDDGEVVEIDLEHLMDRGFDFLDKHPSRADDRGAASSPVAGWGWYRWATPASRQYNLAQWRAMLASSFASRGVTTRLAVGLHNQSEPWIVKKVGFRTVVFFDPRLTPNSELADRIAATPLNSLTR